MIDAKMISVLKDFDLQINNKHDIDLDVTGETLITCALFTTPWWADAESGSRFEETADTIINNDTRKNITAVLQEVTNSLPFQDLKFSIQLSTQDVAIQATWQHKDSVARANF